MILKKNLYPNVQKNVLHMIRAFPGIYLIYACLKYLRYKLWFCRAKGCICSPPIRTPPSRYCISRLALCILNCTLTIQTPFQKRLFVLFISFRHLKSETNYGARNHRYTLVFQFFPFLFKVNFYIPKSSYILHSKNTALCS